jgi:hypothetical protein
LVLATQNLGGITGCATRIRAVTEPTRDDDAPLEPEVREAARGESARTPALVIGGVAGVIAVVVGVLAVVAFLLWWLL